MNKKTRKLLIIFTALVAFSGLGVSAAENAAAKPLALRAETNTVNMEMVIKDNFVKA